MDPETNNIPANTGADPEGDALRAAAQQRDANETPLGSAEPVSTQPDPAPRAAEDVKPTESKVTTTKTDNADASSDPPRDEHGRFTKADGTKSQPNEAAPPAKKETDYSKAQKEQERRDRSWKALEEEKAAFRAERAKAQQFESRPAPELKPAPGMEFTSKQLDTAAADFAKEARELKAEGDHAGAAENFALAEKARIAADQARKLEMQHQGQQTQSQFAENWTRTMKATIEESPDLGNPESPYAKEVMGLFEKNPVFSYIPDGFRHAAQIAKWKMGSEKASALEEKVNELTAQLEAERERTQPYVANGAGQRFKGAKSFEQMTDAEQEAHLRQASEREGAIQKG